jgi:hypothetical protein
MFSLKKWAGAAACLLLSLSVAPLFSQAVAEQKQSVEGFVASIRQAKINPEREAYMALYNEQVPAKKIELAGKFLTDYPETELKIGVYQMQIDSYQRLGNIEKLVETAEKFAADFPHFPTLLRLSSILARHLPTEEDKKAAQLDKALDYSNRAKAEIESLQKPAQMPDELWTKEKNKLLATVDSTIALVHRLR